MNRTFVILMAVAVAAGAVWAIRGSGEELIPYQSQSAITAGKTIYAEQCAACHGANLEGAANWRQPEEDGKMPAPPHDETGHTWHHPDLVLFEITKYGSEAVVGGGYESNMPGFSDTLSDQQIRSVLAYIKSTWPERIVEIHNARNG